MLNKDYKAKGISPIITVVTVSYNSASTIERTILSVINQNYAGVEYIIIDGKSEDGTMDIIKKYENYLSAIVSEKDNGIYDAMNKGIDLASGELIVFLNSDDWFSEDALQKVAVAYQNSHADVIHGDLTFVEGNISRRCKYNNISNMRYEMSLGHPATFVKTSLMKEYHFDTSYKIAADYNFLAQLFYTDAVFEYLDENLAFFSVGGTSTLNYLTVYEGHNIAVTLAQKHGALNEKLLSELDKRYYRRLCYYAHKTGEFPSKTDMEPFLNSTFKSHSCYVFGYGVRGKRTVNLLKRYEVQIKGIVDNHAYDIRDEAGIIVKPEECIFDNESMVVISPLYVFEEICNQLVSLGIREDRIIDLDFVELSIGKIIHDKKFKEDI